MSNALDLISGSLRLIGAIATGEAPSTSEQSDGLSVLNQMIDSWSNDGFLIFKETTKTFSLTPGKSRYTLGPGGDFDNCYPMEIKDATFKQSANDLDFPMTQYNLEQWNSISLKDQQSTIPNYFYFNRGAPLCELKIWPVPSESSTITLSMLNQLLKYDSLDDELCLPPGYERMLRFNLAIELAPEYGLEPSATVRSIATESKALIQRKNTKFPLMVPDAFGLNERKSYDIWRPIK